MLKKLFLGQKELSEISDLLNKKINSLEKELEEKTQSLAITDVVQQEIGELNKTLVYVDSFIDRDY